jgi:GT2 family glycosyltransferase
MAEPRIGAVVIGRNEAEHIGASLRSVRRAVGDAPIVYVDSASRDESVAIASTIADEVHGLDPATPLSAARARNEGFGVITAKAPGLDYVLLLDGDCLLQQGFVPAAVEALDRRNDLAAVVGNQLEKQIADSVFTRLSALEWWSVPGDITDFGNITGNMVVRVTDFRAHGGFNPRVIAGEDSEFGVRLKLAGRLITKLDMAMAEHQGCITSFDQWWSRAVRAGHALAERYMLHGRSAVHDCRREFFSTIFWGLGMPAVAILLAWQTYGLSLLLLPLGYAALFLKMVRTYHRKQGHSLPDAILQARFGLYDKAANTIGLIKYFRRRMTGQVQIIEYKRPIAKETVS